MAEKTISGNISAYIRYKYSESLSRWQYEYQINNSHFTSNQWSAINSGVTKKLVDRWNEMNTCLTTEDLDNSTIIYDTEDNKVKLGNTI